ncbi:MAG: ribose 5-phosphate isomerase B [Syntrophomonadaceae bacterium]|nr:ribose 5-phosphate isomerase B [Syntrophomonadaceae bacterium]
MKVAIGSDHAGFHLKKEIIVMLEYKGYEVLDCGCFSPDSVDYPDIAEAVAEEVLKDQCPGIVICGTGIGISMAANKIPGIRAALCGEPFSARMAREHNDANILAMGARIIGTGLAIEVVKAFLDTSFAGERHQLRVDKIREIERKHTR